VRRVFKSRMPSIIQSLVLVYSRLIIKYPKEMINFLVSVSVENREGLKVLIDKWILHLPRFSGKYYVNLSLKAITLLFSLKDPLIESLMVIGYDPSHTNACVEINAPLKILSTLIRFLNNEIKSEEMKKKKTDYAALDLDNFQKEMYQNNLMDDANGDDEKKQDKIEEEDNKKVDVNMEEFKNLQAEDKVEINSKLHFVNLQGKGGGLSNIETGSEIYLSQLLGFDYNDIEAEEDDTTNEEDLYLLTDIEYDFTVKDFLTDFFKSKLETDSEYIKECLKLLPKSDQDMFKSFKL